MAILAAVLLAAAVPAAADAAAGFRDFSWQATGVNGPTGEKPQSKLWYNDGIWWADMFDVASNSWRIFRLDTSRQAWVNTGTALDPRPGSWADTLWDGTHLYVASAGVVAANAADSARLYRYSYSAATKTYSLDAGFPATIVSGGMEAIVMDKDSTGHLWATWTRNSQVYVNTTNGDDSAWGTPFVLPVAGTTVDPDDISSVVSVKGRIGVMWSNQVANAMYYSEHADGASPTSWSASIPVVQGTKTASCSPRPRTGCTSSRPRRSVAGRSSPERR
jgi:type II secretory pathway pseudopilin PulG